MHNSYCPSRSRGQWPFWYFWVSNVEDSSRVFLLSFYLASFVLVSAWFVLLHLPQSAYLSALKFTIVRLVPRSSSKFNVLLAVELGRLTLVQRVPGSNPGGLDYFVPCFYWLRTSLAATFLRAETLAITIRGSEQNIILVSRLGHRTLGGNGNFERLDDWPW